MSVYPVSVSWVSDNCSSECEVIVAKIKAKNKSPSDYKWTIHVGETIESFDMRAFLSGTPMPKEKSLKEKMVSLPSKLSCFLHAKHRHSDFSELLSTVPQFIIDSYRKQYEKDETEQKRIDSLTQVERDAETEAALKELRSHSGFIEMRLK